MPESPCDVGHKLPCEGLRRQCPGPCNPRLKSKRHAEEQKRESYDRQPGPPPTSPSSAADYRPTSAALSPEDLLFIDDVRRKLDARRRERCARESCLAQRFVLFLVFFFVQGLIGALTRNNHLYQTFIATQFCGFVIIMFWNDSWALS